MKPILTLALKDIRVLTRDWFGLFWIAVFPLMFALFFGAIFSGQGRANPISIAVIDEEQSAGSKEFIARLKQSEALKVEHVDVEAAREQVKKGKRVAYLVVKSGFAGSFFGGTPRTLELGVDPGRRIESEAIKGMLMELAFSDFKDVFTDPAKSRAQMQKALAQIEGMPDMPTAQKLLLRIFFKQLDEFMSKVEFPKGKDGKGGFEMVKLNMQNVLSTRTVPVNSFEISFPSSVLWGIIGCATGFAISLVEESVKGTLLRLRTAPMTRLQLLAGKGLACWLTCVTVTVALLVFAALALGVRLGDPLLLSMAIVCTGICFTGLMMLMSTTGKTEQAVAGAGWGIMMPLAMLGGAMVPLIAMPGWMQTASHVSPIKWSILAIEGSIWRGFDFADMLLPCGVLLAVGIAGFAAGVAILSRRE